MKMNEQYVSFSIYLQVKMKLQNLRLLKESRILLDEDEGKNTLH